MLQLNLDNFHLSSFQPWFDHQEVAQLIQQFAQNLLILYELDLIEAANYLNLIAMNLVVRDTVLADIPQLQCAVNKETLKNFIVGLTKLYNTLH